MPTKTWAVGEEVIAGDFQTHVQNQVVATFANAAARNAAITAPLAGMVTWLTDTKMLSVYDGTAWRDVAPGLFPRSTRGAVLGAGGTYTGTSWASLPVSLAVSGFVKQRADTVLVMQLFGHAWVDDPLANLYLGIEYTAGTVAEVDVLSTIGASASVTTAGIARLGIGAGTYNLTAKWRTSGGGMVATQVGTWQLYVAEQW
jgi:hypothetical protein